MKKFLSLALLGSMILAQTSVSLAWAATTPVEKLYTFKFKLSQETYEYTQKAPSYEDAFGKAAQACFDHYRGGRRVSEDRGLDIIDVCANPRS